jgi:hypothetical protein
MGRRVGRKGGRVGSEGREWKEERRGGGEEGRMLREGC